MKLEITTLVLLGIASVSSLKIVVNSAQSMDTRRAFVGSLSTVALATSLFPGKALAKDPVPSFASVETIYGLGTSLSTLATKIETATPNMPSSAIVGLEVFAKDKDFYPTFARAYVVRYNGVSTGADSDGRVIAINNARSLILAAKAAIDFNEDRLIDEKVDKKKAAAFIRDAQKEVAKFLRDCQVKDDRIDSFVKSVL